ncbi:hypothetical protein [Rhodococcoides yunnanense]|uniref:hypothetical protein n=1 Tax=Rhodococcoides yunnanense TaxID=278209 RepID=UPI000935088F|nr:hypothetical protein [Rhodococcus yunnanensis]
MTGSTTDPEDTGQISVAELLARNGQKTDLNAGGRRRRGVKGGISVAELTGEIPIVRAAPAAVDAPVIEPESEAPPTRTRSTARRQAEPELLSGSTTAAADLLNQAHDLSEARDLNQARDDGQVRDDSERRPYGARPSQRPVPVTQRPAPEVSKPDVSKPDVSKPAERSARTSGFVPRSRAARTEDAEPKTDVRPTPAGPVTGKPQTPQASKAEAPQKSEAQRATALVQPRTQAIPKAELPTPVLPKAELPKPMLPAEDAAEKVSLVKPASEQEDAATAVSDTEVSDAEVSDTEVSEAAGAAPAVKKDAARQWLVLAGQAVVSIIVGALLFKGFEKLWDVLPWVALILAVLVIVGLVAVVRILRRTDDMISMVIAIAVGVFVTLGPLAFQLSTG